MKVIIITTLVTAIATLISLVVYDILFKGFDKELPITTFFKWIIAKITSAKYFFSKKEKQFIQELVSFLQKDQDKKGFHKGQFGKGQRTEEEKRYQTSNEKLDTKPRLYLTGRPTVVLKKMKSTWQILRMLVLVKQGLYDLLKSGSIKVGVGATQFTIPYESSSQGAIISYRHTIKAVQILLQLDEFTQIVKDVIGRMIDSTNSMQDNSGGWKQCDKNFTEPDMWGSSYALGFLNLVILKSSELGLNIQQIEKIEKAIQNTIGWFINEWRLNYWTYGKVPKEENVPILFCEISDVLIKYNLDFTNEVLGFLKDYLDPLGNPSTEYINKLKLVGECAVSTRLAYCFFLARELNDEYDKLWKTLFAHSLLKKDFGFNSVEAAMLLDMQNSLLNSV